MARRQRLGIPLFLAATIFLNGCARAPVRLALTARGDGPELKKLLPLIGRAKAVARLKGQVG